MGRHFTGLIDSSQQNFTMPIRPYGRSRMAAKLKGISRLKKSEKHDDEYPDELWKFMSPSEKAKFLVADVFSRSSKDSSAIQPEEHKQKEHDNEH